MKGKKHQRKINKKKEIQPIFHQKQSQDDLQVPRPSLRKRQPYRIENPVVVEENLRNKTIGKIQKPSSQGPKQSFNHNFQRHAVVTVRRMFDFAPQLIRSESQRVAHIMWTAFKTSPLTSKRTLNIIFGAADMNSQAYQGMLESCGFGQLLRFEEHVILAAQNELRLRFVRDVQQIEIRDSMKTSRRIIMSQQFMVYFMELVQQLRKGPLLKFRFNDSTVRKIQSNIQINNQRSEQSPFQ